MVINSSGLLGPQAAHTQSLVDSIYLNGFALDASETGTGKTYCAAAVARELNRPVVVICPKAVMPAWTKVFNLFGISPLLLINYEKIGRGNTPHMKWKKLPNPEKPWDEKAKISMPDFRIPREALVVLDEGHKCKGADTTNSWMLVALVNQNYNVLMSSATAACSPMEMRAFGYMTGLHSLHNFREFCRMHGAEWLGRYGAMVWDAGSNAARESMLRLNEYLYDTRKCASRMTREQFGVLFPESHVVAESYDLGPTATKNLQHAESVMEYELAQLEEKCEGYSEHIFAIMTRYRRHSELLKVPMFVDMIEDLFDEGKSIAVFVNYDDTVQAISKLLREMPKFKGLIGYVVGGQNADVREKDIQAFQSDQKRVIIANTAAGGVGISLHDLNGKHPRASIISPTWSAQNMMQCLGRIWRQGGQSKSYQRIVYASGVGIEEKICLRVQFKLNCLNTLNDGDLAEHVLWLEAAPLLA